MNIHRTWKWIIIALAILLIAAGAIFFSKQRNTPELPSGFVEKEKSAEKILADLQTFKDVDIRPLVELEAKKDYAGAVTLMDSAIVANSSYRDLNSSLTSVAGELVKLSSGVKSADVGAKAKSAFDLLLRYSDASKKYFDDRETLYRMTRDYYSSLASKKSPPIPDNLKNIVTTVNTDLTAATELKSQFASALAAFNQAAGIK